MNMNRYPGRILIFMLMIPGLSIFNRCVEDTGEPIKMKELTLYPIGEVVRENDRTYILIKPEYRDGLLKLEDYDEIMVLYWFDRNDDPEKRSILQVHPKGDPENPIRGVFATHAPVRPNLIGVSRCRLLSVQGNRLEIGEIDAMDQSPILDIKSMR